MPSPTDVSGPKETLFSTATNAPPKCSPKPDPPPCGRWNWTIDWRFFVDVPTGAYPERLSGSDNPLQFAETIAMLDMISKGRLVSGIVRGAGQEMICMNANPAYNRERFDEELRLTIERSDEISSVLADLGL